MTRKEFVAIMGAGASVLLLPTCLGTLSGCSGSEADSFPAPPTNVDFTIDVSTGPLANNGGFLVQNGIIIGRTTTGSFIAVSSNCTHQGTILQFVGSSNSFHCNNHGSNFDSNGSVTNGPASKPLVVYSWTLVGTTLRVFTA